MTLYFSVPDSDPAELQKLARSRGAVYEDYPGLVSKAFVFDESNARYGSHFLWADDASAQNFLDSALLRQMVERFGHEPEVTQFIVFGLVVPARTTAPPSC